MPTATFERQIASLSETPRAVWSTLARATERAREAISRRRGPARPSIAYVPGVVRLRSLLVRPAILGLVGSIAVVVGASQPSSPFELKLPGTWYFGLPAPSLIPDVTPKPGQGLFLGVVAVYGGMLLLLRAWYDVARIASRYRGMPVRVFVPIFAAWVVPLLVVAPLFSRDVYSYAAMGEMMSHGINPYLFGPSVLGSASPFGKLVDPLWLNVPSPYGPAFLTLAGWIVSAVGHNVLASVVGLRLVALAGTVAFAAAVPGIARSFGHDGATAFVLAALNPLILLHLVAGAHNDALMLGLLAVGYLMARSGHPILGIVICGVAAAVKVPAVVGAIYIGWDWIGPGHAPRERIRPAVTALVIVLTVLAVLSEVAGLGWGWIGGLKNPDAVRSWLDPATALGLFGGHIVSLIGLGNHSHLLLTLARGSFFMLAAGICLVLLWRSEQIGTLRALGWSFIVIVVLGPVIQPWYLTWGFVFLVPVVDRRNQWILVLVSGVGCFLGLPGGRVLIDELGIANPFLVAAASIALVALATALVYPRLRRLLARPSNGLQAVG